MIYNAADPVTVSPDGKFAAINTLDGKVMLQPLDGGPPRAIPRLEDGSEPLRWCPDNRSLLVYHFGEVPAKILRVDVNTGVQILWRELSPANKIALQSLVDIRVGADCQSSAYSPQYQPSELWVATGMR